MTQGASSKIVLACVYVVTNLVNGKRYVGVTTNFDARKKCHFKYNLKPRAKSLLKSAVKKYGPEAFDMQMLFIGTRELCYKKESDYINLCGSRSPEGYNICSGGRGSHGLNGELNGMYGRRGDAHPNFGKRGYRTGIPHSEEARRKMSESHKGRIFSAETRKKLSEAAKNRTTHMKYMWDAAAKRRAEKTTIGL